MINENEKTNESDFIRKNPQLLRSILRACFRATPYGLSSTSTFGKFSNNDNIFFSFKDVITSSIEVSGEIILSIIKHFNKLNISNESAYLILNPSISIIGDRIRYFNNEDPYNGQHIYYEREIRKEDTLIIEFMRQPRRLRDIKAFLYNAGFSCREYIHEAITVGFIKPELCLPIHQRNGIKFISDYFKKNHAEHGLSISELDNLNLRLGNYHDISINELIFIEEQIKHYAITTGIKLSENIKSYLLVDSTREMKNCTLSESTTEHLLNSTEKLLQKTFRPHPLHQTLALEIHDKFGDEAVPAGLLFDPKYGIDVNRLSTSRIKNLYIDNSYNADLREFLINCLTEQTDVINLDNFGREVKIDNGFTGGALLAQVQRKNKNYKFSILSISGPEGIELFSRVALADNDFKEKLHSVISNNGRNEFEYLDICHIPSAKGWHATMRPDLWDNSFLFPGTYSENSRKVTCMDLFVRVENGLIALYHRDGKKLIPRVSSPHDMLHIENLPLYRALACIGTPYTVGFQWPSIFENIKYLPRVVLNDIWITPARLKLTIKERNEILSSNKPYNILRGILEPKFISDTFEIGYGDKFLPILDNQKHFSIISSLLRDEKTIIQERFLTSQLNLNNDSNSCEIVLPFTVNSTNDTKTNHRSKSKINFDNYDFHYSHNHLNKWLSFKIYCSPVDADNRILQGLAELSEHIIKSGYCGKWFFIRYGDPDFHLRYRIKINVIDYRSDVLSILSEFLDQLTSKYFIKKWEADTYLPEMFRYGGSTTLPICESIFHIDSKYCQLINKKFHEESDAFIKHFINAKILLIRLRFSNHSLLQSQELITRWQENYIIEIGNAAGVDIRKKVNKELSRRPEFFSLSLNDILPETINEFNNENQMLITNLNSEASSNNTTISFQNILDSLFHMFCNRLYSTWSRELEYYTIYLSNRLLSFKIHNEDFK